MFLQALLAFLDLLEPDLIPSNMADPDQVLFLEMIHPDLMSQRETVLTLVLSTMGVGSLL